jgi:hypothetical protein
MTAQYSDARFEAVLAECAERVRAGEDIGRLLSEYPTEYRGDLALLMPVAAELDALAFDPSSEFVLGFEPALMRAVDEARTAQRSGAWARFARAWQGSAIVKFASAAPIALFLLAGSGLAAAEASKESLPGSALYPVRQVRERAELLLARSPEARVSTYSHHITERGADLERAADAATVDTIDEVAVQALRSVRAMVDEALSLQGQGAERASVNALLAIRAIQARLDRLQADAPPRHRPIFMRLREALRGQEARLVLPRDERPPGDRQQALPPVERAPAATTPLPTRETLPTATPVPMRDVLPSATPAAAGGASPAPIPEEPPRDRPLPPSATVEARPTAGPEVDSPTRVGTRAPTRSVREDIQLDR